CMKLELLACQLAGHLDGSWTAPDRNIGVLGTEGVGHHGRLACWDNPHAAFPADTLCGLVPWEGSSFVCEARDGELAQRRQSGRQHVECEGTMPKQPRPDRDPVLVDLALQGGGSHGAFTWGVLDRLRE